MILKRFTPIALMLAAVTLSFLTVSVLAPESGDEAKREQKEKESANAYAEWRHSVLANQVTGQIDPAWVMQADRDIAALQSLNKTNAGAMQWIEVGPDNSGGRTRSVVIDRNNSSVIYAGSVGGGIWKSTTGGASWNRVNDSLSSLAICCMTQAKDGAIYVGTGEDAFVSVGGATNYSPGFAGVGVFKSTDGVTFTLLASTDASTKNYWANTNDIVADPTNAAKIYAGNTNGLYITTDGGATWTKASPTGGACLDLDISPDGQTIAAVVGPSIYISKDAGNTFNKVILTTSDWGGNPGRISIAIAPSNPNMIYAMAASNTTQRFLSLLQSKDKGTGWSRVALGSTPYADILGSDLQGQGYWNNVTSVDPSDPEHVYLGGIDIWDWTPSTGINPISAWYFSTLSNKYVHADNHAIVWDTKTTPATMYIGNDGGVFKSLDKGKNFFGCNRGYNVTQFFAVAAGFDQNKNAWVVGGGSQDNGSWLVDGLGNTKLSGVKMQGGDGGAAEFSQKINGYALFSTYDTDIESYRNYTNRDNDKSAKYDQAFYNARMSAYCKDSGVFNPQFALWESKGTDSTSMVFVAGKGAIWVAKDVYRDFSAVPNWYRLTNISGTGSCIDVSQDGNTILVGMSNGLVVRVDSILSKGIFDSANAWVSNVKVTNVFSSGGRFIAGVSFSKTDKNKSLITLGNWGNNDYVYYSTNSIANSPSYNSIQGNLPKIPVYDAEINWDDPNMLILATERGIFVSRNFTGGSPTYAKENNGMANVPTFMIRQYKNPSPWYKFEGPRFFIATHGRGFFMSTSYARVGMNKVDENLTAVSVYPNPATTETSISFITKKAGKATVSIYNMQGSLVMKEEINTTSGKNNYGMYVNQLANGNYITVVDHDGTRQSARLVVVH